MKKILSQTILICATLMMTTGFYGCVKFLDQVPENDIETIESIFETRDGAYKFFNTCMSVFNYSYKIMNIETNPALTCGGEYTAGEYLRNTANYFALVNVLPIMDGFQNTTSPYFNIWTMEHGLGNYNEAGSMYACIRFCNIFIEHIDEVTNMTQTEKDRWKAEIKCLKAYYYFQLMKLYGPICLVPQNIPVDADIVAMQIPRSPVDQCFDAIVELIDEAIPYLQRREQKSIYDKASFSIEGAYAFKAKVLMFAASPLFNGNEWYSSFTNRDGVKLFPEYDKEKWRIAAEAADKAVEELEAGGIKLRQGTSSRPTKLQNIIYDLQFACVLNDWSDENEEWLISIQPRANNDFYRRITSPKWNSRHWYYNDNMYGAIATNIRMVEMYYTENGLPIDKDRTWPYNSRYKMGKETDPRYMDVVVTEKNVLNLHLRREPRFYAAITGDDMYWTWANTNSLIEPYRNQPTGTEVKRFDDPTYPQNISGYWAKKLWLPTEYQYSISKGINLTIMRAAEVYLIQAETWNEYSGPSEKVYNALDKVRGRAGLIPVRQAWQSYSISPDEVNTQSGLREIIQQERMIELAFEGHHFWDLRRWKRAHLELNQPHKGWNILGTTAAEFYNNYDGPKIVSSKPKFVAPRDYFWPIKVEEVIIANIVQNPGW